MKKFAWMLVALGCAGADGEDGLQGPPGQPGAPGLEGTADIVTGTALCTGDVDGSYLTLYAWFMADDSVIGICDLDEYNGSDTEPLIGSSCTMVSRRLINSGAVSGLITITVTDAGVQVSGEIEGDLTCTVQDGAQ